MEQEKQEALATLLWRFIEQIREQEQLGTVVKLNPAEVRELLDLLGLAANVREALVEVEATAPDHLQARRRLEQALRDGPSPLSSRAGRLSRGRWLSRRTDPAVPQPVGRRPRWGWMMAAAAVTLVTGLFSLQIGRSLPRPDPLTHPPARVVALSHDRVRQWLPRLLKNQFPPAEARAMWWHLAYCDGCFHAYEQMGGRHPHQSGAATPETVSPLVVALWSNPVEGLKNQSAWMR